MEEGTAPQLGAEEVIHGPALEESQHTRPFGLFWRSHTLFIVGAVTIGLFSETMLYGIVVPILPFILHDRMGVPYDKLQAYSSSLLAAYAGSSVVSAPLAGLWVDRFRSRSASLVVGLAVLLIVRPFISSLPRLPALTVSGYHAVSHQPFRFGPYASEVCPRCKFSARLDGRVCTVF